EAPCRSVLEGSPHQPQLLCHPVRGDAAFAPCLAGSLGRGLPRSQPPRLRAPGDHHAPCLLCRAGERLQNRGLAEMAGVARQNALAALEQRKECSWAVRRNSRLRASTQNSTACTATFSTRPRRPCRNSWAASTTVKPAGAGSTSTCHLFRRNSRPSRSASLRGGDKSRRNFMWKASSVVKESSCTYVWSRLRALRPQRLST